MHGRSLPRKQQPLSFLLPSLQLRVLAAYGALFILVLQTYLPEEILPRALLSCPPNFDDDDEDDGSRSGGGLASLGEGRGAVLMGGRAMEEWSSSLADGGGDQTRPPPPPSSGGVRGFSVPVGAAATAARGGDGAGGAAGATTGGGGSGTGEGGALQKGVATPDVRTAAQVAALEHTTGHRQHTQCRQAAPHSKPAASSSCPPTA